MTVRREAGSGLDVVLLAVGFIWLRGPSPPPLRSRSVRGRPPSSLPLPPALPRPLSAPPSPPPAAGSRARARGDHVLTEGRGRRRRGGRRRGAGLGSSPRAARGVAAAGRRGPDGEEEQELEEEPPPPPGNRASGGRPAAGPSQPRRGLLGLLPGPLVCCAARRAPRQARGGDGGAAVCRGCGHRPGCGGRVRPACLPTVDRPAGRAPAPPPLFRQAVPSPSSFSCRLPEVGEWGVAPAPPQAPGSRVHRRGAVLVSELVSLSPAFPPAPPAGAWPLPWLF